MFLTRHRNLTVSIVRLSAVATSLLMLTVLIVTNSQAAFSATTDNTGNSFQTGSVVLTDDDASSAMFAVTSMSPGTPVVECITVTYSGTLVPANIRMYGATAGTLAPYLDTTIEVGTGGSSASCTGFTPSSTLYSGTLSNFSTTHTNWSTGLATFTAAANPTSRTLRFSVEVQNTVSAQGKSATADFTFEAQN